MANLDLMINRVKELVAFFENNIGAHVKARHLISSEIDNAAARGELSFMEKIEYSIHPLKTLEKIGVNPELLKRATNVFTPIHLSDIEEYCLLAVLKENFGESEMLSPEQISVTETLINFGLYGPSALPN